jgi:hypothetical protein
MNNVETSPSTQLADDQHDSIVSGSSDFLNELSSFNLQLSAPFFRAAPPVLSPLSSPTDALPSFALPSPTSSSQTPFFSTQARVFKSSKYGTASPASSASGEGEPKAKRPTLPKAFLNSHAREAIDLADARYQFETASRSSSSHRSSEYTPTVRMSTSPSTSSVSLSRISSTSSVSSLSSSSNPRHDASLVFSIPTSGSISSMSSTSPSLHVEEDSQRESPISPSEPPVATIFFPPNTAAFSPVARLMGDTSGGPSSATSSERSSASRSSRRSRQGHQYTLSLSQLMGHSVPKPSGPATVFASGKPVKGKVLQLRPELDSQKTLVENELATVATVDPVLVSAKKVAELEASDDTIQPIPNGKAVAGRIHPDQASRKLVAGA